MKIIFSICVVLIIFVSAEAQQDPQFTHNMFNQVWVNPAYAGTSGQINATAIKRQQWLGFTGAPSVTLLTIDAPVSFLGNNGGVALNLLDDRQAFEKKFNPSLLYSYHRNMGSGILSAGISVGLYNLALDGDWKATDDPATDQSIPAKGEHKMVFDMNLGVFYAVNNFNIGLSTTHINKPSFKFATSGDYFLKRNFYLISKYTFSVTSLPLEFIPSAIVKYDGIKSQFDINFLALYNKKIWGGVSYRNEPAFCLMAGLELINGIRLGYAYDITMNKIRKGSHEVFLNYSFLLDFGLKTVSKHKSVRFLK